MGAASCGGTKRETFVTYFSGDHRLSIRYPASWKTEQAEQDGIWYRYFLGPPAGPQRNPMVSATLLVGALGGPLEDYAQTYLAGNTLASSREESRGEARGKSYFFSSADGATRNWLLLLEQQGKVYGFYAQGESAPFERHLPYLEEMARSLTFERPDFYPEQRDERYAFSLRIPPSWRSTRSFSGGGSFFLQFTSPPLAVDKDRQTVHASLTLTVESLPSGGDLESFYRGNRERFGGAFQILSHRESKGTYVDLMQTETPIAVSRVKRFYQAAEGRGYCLAFESREDVFSRATQWYDLIAGTLKIGSEARKR